jgi:hypothetical protein
MNRNQRNAPRDGHKTETRGHGCACCNHQEREAIDYELVARTPLSKLSARFGMSEASLSRHRTNHISKALVAIRPTLPEDASQLQHLEAQAARLETSIAQAEKAGRFEQLVTGSRELRITREAIAKAKGEANGHAAAVVDLQRTPEWLAIRQVVFDVLEPHPKLRVELAKRLLALDGRS